MRPTIPAGHDGAQRLTRRNAWVIPVPLIAGACGVRLVDPAGARPTPVPPASDDAVVRIDVQGAHARWLDGSAVLVDTRETEAYLVGHAGRAISMPLAEVDADPLGARGRLPVGKLAIFYCT